MEPPFRLVYQSVPSRPISSHELDVLLVAARAFNDAHGLTGSLVVVHEGSEVPARFVQWVEGPRASVTACLARIDADDRHRDLQILSEGEIPTRAYPAWSMQRVQVTPDQLAAALDRFGIESSP